MVDVIFGMNFQVALCCWGVAQNFDIYLLVDVHIENA